MPPKRICVPMINKKLSVIILSVLLISACATTQSIIKSTFPYTTDLTVVASAQPGKEYDALSMATSFDQNFTKDGNNAYMINTVQLTSAKLRSINPLSFNIGNISEVKVYMAKPDGSDEIMVASRTDITPEVGNSLVLDIDNSHHLDTLVREKHIRIRMTYKLRNNIGTDAGMRLTLGLSAHPDK